MFFYPHHIGDYKAATAHLSNEEDLAYRRLLDMYYDTEKPIPLDAQWVSRRIRVGAEVVLAVLQDFFVKEDCGWRSTRCDRELAEYHARAEIARSNGKKGGRPKAKHEPTRNPVGNQSGSQPDASGNPDETGSKANHEPGTMNQEPGTISQEPLSRSHLFSGPAVADPGPATKAEPPEPQPSAKRAPAKPRKEPSAGAAAWDAYAAAYFGRYGVEPLRNAKTNGQMSQFCARVPADEAPAIAAWYIQHNKSWYVQKQHSIDCLLADAEGLRTQWATKRQVTATQANQADRTQANFGVFQALIDEAEGRA